MQGLIGQPHVTNEDDNETDTDCALANAQAQTAPKMKMTTDIPPEITTPDSVETRLGTFRFIDGFPDQATVEKVYDNLDFQRGVRAFRLRALTRENISIA
jgi:hypothetical protein